MNIKTHATQPAMTERAADTAADGSAAVSDMAAAFQDLVAALGDTLERARQPGKPLATVSNMTRKAPLASLLAAFVLGIAVARRR